MNSPHKGPITRKMFPFDDVIMMPCGDQALAAIIDLIRLFGQYHIVLQYRAVELNQIHFLSHETKTFQRIYKNKLDESTAH